MSTDTARIDCCYCTIQNGCRGCINKYSRLHRIQHSLLYKSKPLTHVGDPTSTTRSGTWVVNATDCIQLRKLAVGEDQPAIILFDMTLYEKVVQLLDARPYPKCRAVPRLGELHVFTAALGVLWCRWCLMSVGLQHQGKSWNVPITSMLFVPTFYIHMQLSM